MYIIPVLHWHHNGEVDVISDKVVASLSFGDKALMKFCLADKFFNGKDREDGLAILLTSCLGV